MNRHNRNKTLKTTYNTILISRLKYKNLNKIIKHKQFQRYNKVISSERRSKIIYLIL